MLNALVDVMSEALSNGEKVQLTNFGTFERKVQASYLEYILLLVNQCKYHRLLG